MERDTENSAGKQRGKPFRKGQSGNPQGKPRGARNRVLAALDQIGGDAVEDVLQAAVTAARFGDLRAAELILAACGRREKTDPSCSTCPRCARRATSPPRWGRWPVRLCAARVTRKRN